MHSLALTSSCKDNKDHHRLRRQTSVNRTRQMNSLTGKLKTGGKKKVNARANCLNMSKPIETETSPSSPLTPAVLPELALRQGLLRCPPQRSRTKATHILSCPDHPRQAHGAASRRPRGGGQGYPGCGVMREHCMSGVCTISGCAVPLLALCVLRQCLSCSEQCFLARVKHPPCVVSDAIYAGCMCVFLLLFFIWTIT